MRGLFNETFFKFVLGFVALVMASLVLLVVASNMAFDEEIAVEAECPEGLLLPAGEVC